ncbi:efflux RND transporter periplasmic adaptor subunit [Enterovirga rhinocerotis]|uniref:Multidrug efflux system membrane fusion protein n=1 Tax=Enterovirga rhinocerotis TaxID=1339210 RepID=A0A4V3DWE8_9HYPH|nr:efflux RND transporter periplasmic adaptor subunit [Enterovirga rhinocerotis]TDR84549.1 multidrug efflux system membrane fusion protein [Enterovirga rhinocerotis]
MKPSRIAAILLLVGGAAWIGSGVLGRSAQPKEAALEAAKAPPAAARFKVAVLPVSNTLHRRRVVLSGRTEADKKMWAVARVSGVVLDLKVRRGSVVKAGDVIATLSDEAREAQVLQAKARLEQRTAEATARLRLIETGNYPALNKPLLEAELRAAAAGLAQAEAERIKGEVIAPLSGVVNDVPVEVGTALQVFMSGANVAEIIALDPMLAVVEIAERQLNGIQVGGAAEVKLVTGDTARGTIRFVSKKASPTTRTYRVDVELENPDGRIPDGVTAEVDLLLAPVPSARVPRSALTFSAEGRIGVRHVGEDGKVAFAPVEIVEDALKDLWLAGLPDGARVIVEGQDFVKEGEAVETVVAAARG